MSLLRIERRTALPDAQDREASTLYLVQDSGDSGHLELYVTGTNASETRRVVTRTDVDTKIANAIAGFSGVQVVADITARDALVLTANGLALVLDATDDSTVDTGAALYVFDQGADTWHKVAEYESMDFTLNWASLQDKPASLVADIDDAVTKRHSHANMAVLDLLTEDASGNLLYNGEGIEAKIAITQW